MLLERRDLIFDSVLEVSSTLGFANVLDGKKKSKKMERAAIFKNSVVTVRVVLPKKITRPKRVK